MLTHLHSRWFICFPKLRFSDQRKTPQWQTGLCPNKQSSIADHETGDVAFGNFSETVMVSKETNVRYRPEKSYLEYMQMFDF